MMTFLTFDGLQLTSARLPKDRPKGSKVRCHYGQDILWLEYSGNANGDSNDVDGAKAKNNNDDDGVVVDGTSSDDKTTTTSTNTTTSTGRHLSATTLEPYRLLGDKPIDTILQLLDDEGCRLGPGDDLLDRIDQAVIASKSTSTTASLSPSQHAMIQFHNTYYSPQQFPSWVNAEQLALGQETFCAYAGPLALSLFYRSLVPGFSLPKIAAVLQATKYLAPPSTPEQVQARLTDTGAMLAMCAAAATTSSASDFSDFSSIDTLMPPNGKGFQTALRVRVLHAKVRKALLSNKQWSVATNGVPINQEDMAATLLAFSLNALQGVELILGFPLSEREQMAFMMYWRYLGWLLGVPTLDDAVDDTNKLKPLDPCGPGWIASMPDPLEHSKAIFSSILFHLMHPNDQSVKIAHHLLGVGFGDSKKKTTTTTTTTTTSNKKEKKSLDTSRPDTRSNWFYYRSMQCRRFIGDPLANDLELPYHPNWWTRTWLSAVGYVYLMTFRLYTYASLPGSPFRKPLVKLHARQLNRFVESYWKEDHSKRMIKSQPGSDTKALSGSTKTKPNVSMCPFAMVSPPYSDDDHDKQQ